MWLLVGGIVEVGVFSITMIIMISTKKRRKYFEGEE